MLFVHIGGDEARGDGVGIIEQAITRPEFAEGIQESLFGSGVHDEGSGRVTRKFLVAGYCSDAICLVWMRWITRVPFACLIISLTPSLLDRSHAKCVAPQLWAVQ